MRRILLSIIPILGFVGLLRLESPDSIVSFFVLKPFFFFIFTLGLIRLSLFIKREGFIFRFAIILFLFSLPLLYYWDNVITNAALIGGIIPHRDSMYYYLGARKLMISNMSESIAGGRPLFSGLLSVINLFARDNIQTILIVLACLNALAISFLSEKVLDNFSENAASFFISTIILFYSRVIPYMVSEQLGILLSTLCLTFLLEGMLRKNLIHWMLGLFLLSLSLNARAGAMFVLPLFIPFTFFLFHENKKRWELMIYSTLIIISAFLVNSLITKLIINPSVMPFASFANALYGQSKGGAGWTSIQKDFPGIIDSKVILQLALQNIQRYPLGLLIASFKAVLDFCGFGINSAFTTLVYDNNSIFFTLVAWFLIWGLALIALITSLKNLKKSFNVLLIIIFIGTLLSTPFAPPIDSGAMRTYAATIPLLFLLPAQGIEILQHKISRLSNMKDSNGEKTSYQMHPFLISFTLMLVFTICVGPIVVYFMRQSESQSLPNLQNCNPGDQNNSFRLNYGSYILVSPPGEKKCGAAPIECQQNFLDHGSSASNETFALISQWISGQKEKVVFAAVDDILSGNYYQVLIKGSELPPGFPSKSPIYSCLKVIDKREFLYEAYQLRY